MADRKYLKYEIADYLVRTAEWWKGWGVRKWVNANPRIVIICAAATTVLLAGVMFAITRKEDIAKPEDYPKAYYYDLNTGALFVDKKDLDTPTHAPSGKLANGQLAGVKAYVFSYDQNPDESERFIGFLEVRDVNNIGGTSGDSKAKWGEGKLIKRVGDKRWVAANSKEGRKIFDSVVYKTNKNGEMPIPCVPK